MKYFAFVVVIIRLFFVQAQEFKTAFFKDYSLNADKFIGVDDFENSYYINHNNLYKKTAQTIYSYANSQLGEITSVDITNPLKILVFYRDFKTVLLLDNRLNELTTPINFTTESFSSKANFRLCGSYFHVHCCMKINMQRHGACLSGVIRHSDNKSRRDVCSELCYRCVRLLLTIFLQSIGIYLWLSKLFLMRL